MPRTKAHATSSRAFAQTEKSCRMRFCECAFVRKSFRFRSFRKSITHRVDREEAATTSYSSRDGTQWWDIPSRCTRSIDPSVLVGYRIHSTRDRGVSVDQLSVRSSPTDTSAYIIQLTPIVCNRGNLREKNALLRTKTNIQNKLPFMYQIQ